MATQPRFPRDPVKQPQLVPRRTRKRAKFPPWKVATVAITTTLILLSLSIYLVRQGPLRSAPPVASVGPLLPQASNGELHVADMQIIGDPASDTLTLEGAINNTSNRTLNGAEVELKFLDARGNVIKVLSRAIAGVAGGECAVPNEFVRRPLKPNDLRFFCVTVTPIPQDWNRQPPETQVVTVTSPE